MLASKQYGIADFHGSIFVYYLRETLKSLSRRLCFEFLYFSSLLRVLSSLNVWIVDAYPSAKVGEA